MIYTVLVTYTDRTRDDQGFRAYRTTVLVAADNDIDATLIAAQMVAAIRDDAIDGMVIGTTIKEVLI